MTTTQPHFTLNNGVTLPQIGFGVYQTPPEETMVAFEKASAKLGLEQIDLLILHQANPTEFDKTIASYKALETLLADGKLRAIGVSNFLSVRLERLLNETEVVPTVNQIEVHPYTQQQAYRTSTVLTGSSPRHGRQSVGFALTATATLR